jgi:UDP-glucose 4-epimerase
VQHFQPKIVAITGAFGFLGRRVIYQLEEDDRIEKVIAIDVRSGMELARAGQESIDSAAYLNAHRKVSAFQLDLSEAGADREMAAILEREEVDTVCHLAFLSNPTHHVDYAHELETIGTMYVLTAAKAAKVKRLVSLSSTMCYGARRDNPTFLTEDSELRGRSESHFIRDKIDADMQVLRFDAQQEDIPCAVMRLGAILGGSQTRNFWTRYLTRPVVTTVLGYDPMFQFLHASDAVKAILAALYSQARGAFNVVGHGARPLSYIINGIGRRTLPVPVGLATSALDKLWNAQLIEVPPQFIHFLQWPWLADGTKLENELGFRPTWNVEDLIQKVREESFQ